MGKFNPGRPAWLQVREHPDAVPNYEGGLSFTVDPRTELYLRAASCLVGEHKFYESAEFADQELISAIHKVLRIDPEFVLQLAVYLREEMYLRSVPLVLCAEYANIAPGSVMGARKYISRCIARADELTEIIAYQFARNKVSHRMAKLPMAIKAGVAGAFPRFSGYQLAKYNRAGDVTLRDALFMTHPVPSGELQQNSWDALVDGTLVSPDTWEVMRSTGKMTWSEVIHDVFNKDGKVMNYMAQLRNLRNILNSDDVTDRDVRLMCEMISNENAVSRSKLFPFRFLSAYRVVKEVDHHMVNSVLDAIEIAAGYSVDNVPKLDGTTLIACDVSGSMTWQPISKNSSIYPYDIGVMLGSIAHRFSDASITGIFGTEWVQIPMARSSGILSNVGLMHQNDNKVGWATNGHKVIEYLLDNGIEVDRIMIFTDCQMWNTSNDRSFASEFIKYQRLHPNVRLYAFDLTGYGNIMIPQDTPNVCVVGGWSDRIFDFVKVFEDSGGSAIDKISGIRP